MDEVTILPSDSIGKEFIPNEYLIKGKDEFHFRNQQSPWSKDRWRHLNSDEVERLVKNNNNAENWDDILVTDEFNPKLIKNCDF